MTNATLHKISEQRAQFMFHTSSLPLSVTIIPSNANIYRRAATLQHSALGLAALAKDAGGRLEELPVATRVLKRLTQLHDVCK